MRRLLFSMGILFTFCLIFPISIQACSCLSSGIPCEAFWKFEAVFSGEAAEVSSFPIKYTKLPDGRQVYSLPRRKIRFNIDEVFRGLSSAKSVEVTTGAGGGDCGYDFVQGQKYLVYAYRNRQTGELSVSICSRTMLIEKATEDLEYFRSLKTAKHGSTIFGYVVKHFPRRNNESYKKPVPLSNIPVTIEGSNGKLETKTDEKGEYRLTDLLAGEYSIKLDVPTNLWGYEEGRKIKVFDKGCAGSYFALQTKTILSGKLLDENSVPLPKTSVELIPVEQLNQKGIRDYEFGYTNEKGEFLIRSIPNGKYYLGVRFSGHSEPTFQYPRTFYPGVLKPEEAKIIIINEGDILENFDLKLPKKLPLRKIEGIVVYPDETPAANASLTINETEYFYSFSYRGMGQTKSDGTFSFELTDGIRYLLKPYVSLKGGQQHAEPIELPASGDVTNLKFVITEPNGNCQKCLNWKRSQ